MKQFRALGIAAILLLAGSLSASAATVHVANESDWDVYQFFLSPSDEESWGPDQLDDEVLESGGSFQLRNIPCDTYDVKLVDEDGDACIVPGVDICGDDQGWVITSDDLLECEGY